MGARRRLGGVLLAAALAVGLTSGTAGASTPGRDGVQQALAALADAGVAGVQVRIHDEQGNWTGSAGVRELSGGGPVPTDGRFRVGSITKTFVSTVVLQLVHEGRVGLDAPIAQYLPEYGFDPRITVRMILQHTSGLFNYTGEPRPDGTLEPGIPLYGAEFVRDRFHRYTPHELIEVALSKPARFAPGTSWSYSNTNYVVAGQLIERVTGTPWAFQVHKRILAPLGLRGTYLPGTRTDIPGPHAHGYYTYRENGELKVADVTRLSPTWASSAGEIISTTRDLDRFVSALLAGRLLPADLLGVMETPSQYAPYGLGLQLVEAGPSCGGTYYGHTGSVHGYQSFMLSTPDRGTRLEMSITLGAADVDDPAVATRLTTAVNNVLIAALCATPAARPAARPMLVPAAA
ncbi:serine hydrolase domain-containing protein [Actinophytocola sp.]|uniref:serine hydrolase domain-containing protein n=1 Tax=Actinophytocola sp. TaxID=1872138 RepID=UPI00389A335E